MSIKGILALGWVLTFHPLVMQAQDAPLCATLEVVSTDEAWRVNGKTITELKVQTGDLLVLKVSEGSEIFVFESQAVAETLLKIDGIEEFRQLPGDAWGTKTISEAGVAVTARVQATDAGVRLSLSSGIEGRDRRLDLVLVETPQVQVTSVVLQRDGPPSQPSEEVSQALSGLLDEFRNLQRAQSTGDSVQGTAAAQSVSDFLNEIDQLAEEKLAELRKSQLSLPNDGVAFFSLEGLLDDAGAGRIPIQATALQVPTASERDQSGEEGLATDSRLRIIEVQNARAFVYDRAFGDNDLQDLLRNGFGPDLTELDSFLEKLLKSARGTIISLEGSSGDEVSGQLVDYNDATITLIEESKIREYERDQYQIKLETLPDSVAHALVEANELLAARSPNQRTIAVRGEKGEKYCLTYRQQVPAWRVVYQLRVGSGGKGTLSAWASIHNRTAFKWDNISVKLVEGEQTYLLPAVTLASQNVGLFPIEGLTDVAVDSELVTFFNARSARGPKLAARLRNQAGVGRYLVGGQVDIYSNGAYLGEDTLTSLPAVAKGDGAFQILEYGDSEGITVSVSPSSAFSDDTSNIQRFEVAGISDQTMEWHRGRRRRYQVSNTSGQQQKVVIQPQSVRARWRLVADDLEGGQIVATVGSSGKRIDTHERFVATDRTDNLLAVDSDDLDDFGAGPQGLRLLVDEIVDRKKAIEESVRRRDDADRREGRLETDLYQYPVKLSSYSNVIARQQMRNRLGVLRNSLKTESTRLEERRNHLAQLLFAEKRVLLHGVDPKGEEIKAVDDDSLGQFKSELAEYEQAVGEKASLVAVTSDWAVSEAFPSSQVEEVRRQGKLPYVRLLLRSPGVEIPEREQKYCLEEILSGNFDRELQEWGKVAKAVKKPLLVAFGPECNHDRHPWSGGYNGRSELAGFGKDDKPDGPERFVAAYRHVVEQIRCEAGAENIYWVFHADARDSPDSMKGSLTVSKRPNTAKIKTVRINGTSRGGTQWQYFEIIDKGKDKEEKRVTSTTLYPGDTVEWVNSGGHHGILFESQQAAEGFLEFDESASQGLADREGKWGTEVKRFTGGSEPVTLAKAKVKSGKTGALEFQCAQYREFTNSKPPEDPKWKNDWNDLERYYPGDDYVDVIGVTVFGSRDGASIADQPGLSFAQQFQAFHDRIASLKRRGTDGVKRDLPIFVAEMGCSAITKSDPGDEVPPVDKDTQASTWLQAALADLVDGNHDSRYFDVFGFIWSNSSVSKDVVLRVQQLPEAEKAFEQGFADGTGTFRHGFLSTTEIRSIVEPKPLLEAQ
ncbi:MAG: hypothetical protein AAGD07_10885 [Planctomycetota bacterium]